MWFFFFLSFFCRALPFSERRHIEALFGQFGCWNRIISLPFDEACTKAQLPARRIKPERHFCLRPPTHPPRRRPLTREPDPSVGQSAYSRHGSVRWRCQGHLAPWCQPPNTRTCVPKSTPPNRLAVISPRDRLLLIVFTCAPKRMVS